MSGTPDFDKFLAGQKTDRTKHGNLTERKTQWLLKIDALYGQVTDILRPYIDNGSMDVKRSMAEVREDLLGVYPAPSLTIDLGGSSVSFMPVGTLLLGSPGRVDLVGVRGSVRFVLVLPEFDRPIFTVETAFGDRPREKKQGPLDLTPYIWKISTLPPRIRYTAIETSSLQSAIMEAANGRAPHR
ncbi:hypothetical protein [Stenotrophomonas sp. SORGH_AS_0321]|uniref:hypothetical protein n=1 Tax=Stenotrophomonas sp. SORGH_AS_0321 TaxID=3041787 RepID=UPI00285C454E|nr:hypothetical protein [Stenotrophomonas sp. SORGH_AS_0321]MDR6094434.1 hypothetical protein [Stenotrophomonas sp. SORGH_AS_0321]